MLGCFAHSAQVPGYLAACGNMDLENCIYGSGPAAALFSQVPHETAASVEYQMSDSELLTMDHKCTYMYLNTLGTYLL